MGAYGGPHIITDGLVLLLDAASKLSYPGTGTTWYDLSGNNFDFTIDGSGLTYDPSPNVQKVPAFDLDNGGASYSGTITNNTTCTFVFWIKTQDIQSLFWQGPTTSYYLGAYRSGNKEYYANFGTPDYYQNTIEKSNIYDNLRNNEWNMVEFKNVNMSTVTANHFNQYSNYTFGDGYIGAIYIYDRNLTSEESAQNYKALKSRYRYEAEP
jgi:hypothetical protein